MSNKKYLYTFKYNHHYRELCHLESSQIFGTVERDHSNDTITLNIITSVAKLTIDTLTYISYVIIEDHQLTSQ